MPGVQINSPTNEQVVIPGQPFDVYGLAWDCGGAEPIIIDSVVVRVDQGPNVAATLTAGHSGAQSVKSFRAQLQLPPAAAEGPHTVWATATNDNNRSATTFSKRSCRCRADICHLDRSRDTDNKQ